MKQRGILRNLLLITMVWVTSTFNYYMINVQVKHFPGSFDVNTLIMFGSDIPFCILAGYLISTLRVKVVFIMFYGLQIFAGIAILAFIDKENPGMAFPLLIVCARGGIISIFVTVWVAHPKMFPTLFAVTSMGYSNIASRGLVTLAPMVAELAFPTPIILFTILNIISGICSFFIVENIAEESDSNSTTKPSAKKNH